MPGLTTRRVLALAGGRDAYVARLEAALQDRPPAPWAQVWRHVALGGEDLRRRVLAAVAGRDVREAPGFSPRPEETSLDAVLGVVAESTGLQVNQLTAGKYQRVLARKVAIYLARRFTACTLREIGDAFSVDYTTVHMVVRRIDELRARDAGVDDLLRPLEAALQRGSVEPLPAGEPGPPDAAVPVQEQRQGPEHPVPSEVPEEAEKTKPRQPRRSRGRRKERGQLDLF